MELSTFDRLKRHYCEFVGKIALELKMLNINLLKFLYYKIKLYKFLYYLHENIKNVRVNRNKKIQILIQILI